MRLQAFHPTRRLLPPAWAAAVVLAGCGETPKLRFQVDKAIPQQTIQGSITPCSLPVQVPLLGQPFQMTFSQQQDFPEQNTDVQHIESAKLDSMSLALTAATQEPSWDFLDGLEIYAEADGQPRALLASIGAESPSAIPIPAGATTLSLVPAGLQLAPYLKAAGGFSIDSEATGCPPEQDAVFTGEVRINVVADPL